MAQSISLAAFLLIVLSEPKGGNCGHCVTAGRKESLAGSTGRKSLNSPPERTTS
jgi:hypothetical protein